jgi:hypothetical protein
MDHREIEERGLVERYHRGDLPPELEARFEEHFFACETCQEQLELAADFRRALRSMAAEDAAAVTRLGILAWLGRRRGRALGALAALFLAGLPALWLLREVYRAPDPSPQAPEVFLLAGARGDDGPTVTIDLATVGSVWVLAVDVAEVRDHRVVILDAEGEERFRRDGLRPNALETVLLSFPATYFPPGEYRLVLSAAVEGGGFEELTGYRFRVLGAH